ncbi:MAG: hypothetical protein OXR64_14045 [Chloroflexota bacterium]|nr:hypothetical protein [Chloroflexota bacterium]MDE2920952.1 hypothetical protein [Chloroflexota bacterium]
MGSGLPGRWRRAARFACALLLGSLLLGGSPTPDIKVHLDQPSTGFAQSLDFKLGTNEIVDLYRDGGIDRAAQFGADLVRVWVGHRFLGAVAGSTPADFDWSRLHTFVQRVLDAGATPMVSFVAAPAWVTAADGTPSSQHESERFNAAGVRGYAEYVADAIERLRDHFGPVALTWPYTIWNEPNNHQNAGQHYACGSGAAYAELYAAARAAAARRFGSGVVAIGGPSLDAIDTGATLNPDGSPTCGNAPDVDWSTYLRAVDSASFHDFLTWHWYGMHRVGETTSTDVLGTRLSWFENRVRLISGIAAGRPHYVEEINFNGDLAVDPLVHAPINGAFLASATLRALRQGASGLLVYKGTRDPSGKSPRGEPDFGLWSSAIADPPAPAFGVMQLVRRFVAGSGRLTRVDVRGPDLDALVVDTDQGPRAAVVNLSPSHRTVRVSGLPAAPAVAVSGETAWTLSWFDGTSVFVPGFGLAVIDGSLAGLPALPTVERGRRTYDTQCSSCHGVTPLGARAPGLAGASRAKVDGSHAAALLTHSERINLANFLSGWRSNGRIVTGIVQDENGTPISGALVIAVGFDSGTAAWTDAAGKFQLRASDPLGSVTSTPRRLMAFHADHGVASAPLSLGALPSGPTATFALHTPTTSQRPLLASSYVVDAGDGIHRLGTASAGASEIWAVAAGGGIARRLVPEPGSAFGVRRTHLAAADASMAAGNWVIAAIGSNGAVALRRVATE